MLDNNLKTVKILQDYFLSKVEVVEWYRKRYILKSVPNIWDTQIKRQDYLVKHCGNSHIPKIHWTRKIKGRKYFLMDLIESGHKPIPDEMYIKTLDVFHAETTRIKNQLFPVYDFSVFKHEYPKIRKLLPKYLDKRLGKKFQDFEDIFHLQTSVVHGDWVKAQLIGNKKKYAIIDFEMAFYGPSILDHAHFFLKDKTIHKDVLALLDVDKETFLKARIVEALRKLGWFVWFMENKFTTYKFQPEIKEYIGILDRLTKENTKR